VVDQDRGAELGEIHADRGLIQYTHMRRGAAWPLLLRAVLYRPVLQRDRFEQCHRKWDDV
jgi:hypothetical protein